MLVFGEPGGPASTAPRCQSRSQAPSSLDALAASLGPWPSRRARPSESTPDGNCRLPDSCARPRNLAECKLSLVAIVTSRGGLGLAAQSSQEPPLKPCCISSGSGPGRPQLRWLPPAGERIMARVSPLKDPGSTGPAVSILLNGEHCTLMSPVSLVGLVDQLGLQHDAVAIEHNREVVRRHQWSATSLRDGDRVEVVHFVGGG